MKRQHLFSLLFLCLGFTTSLAISQSTAPLKPTATQPATRKVTLAIGQKAPPLDAITLDNKPATLADFARKPLVLQFGSITEPVFRLRAPAVEKLAADYADKAAFFILYQRESHPADGEALEINQTEGYNIAQPVRLDERIKLAKMAVERLKLQKQTILIDAWSDLSSQRYGGHPNMTFLIDADGNLAAGYPWMDTKKISGALDALLANKPIPEEFQGPKRPSTIPALTTAEGTMEMSSGPTAAGPGLATVLDRLTLSEKQRAAIYPPLTQLLADLRDLRELRNADGKTDGKAAGVDAAELQKKLEALRTQADKVRVAFKENLDDKDAQAVLEALDRAPGARLLNRPKK